MRDDIVKYMIFDDVELTYSFLQQIIAGLSPSFNLVGVVDDVDCLADSVISCNPDLIFSRISLNNCNVIPEIRRNCPRCPVILFSEYERSLVDCTGLLLIDYLLEPVTSENIGLALNKFELQYSGKENKSYNLIIYEKLFTIMIAAFLLASIAFAGSTVGYNVSQLKKNVTEISEDVRFDVSQLTFRPGKSLVKGGANLLNADGANDVITDIEGRIKYFTKNSSGTIVMNGAVTDYSGDFATKIVYGDNNEVYIYNPLSMTYIDSYIKGIVEGDKITVSLPQTLYVQNLGTESEPLWDGYNLVAMKPVSMPGADGEELMTMWLLTWEHVKDWKIPSRIRLRWGKYITTDLLLLTWYTMK